MIKQSLSEEQAIGKTVKSICISGSKYSSITFTDDTVLIIVARNGYDNCDASTELGSISKLDTYEMKYLNLITEEEYRKILADEQLEYQRKKEENNRKLYEKLKKKYEQS